ncbi:thioredoxin domain-containing protein [Pseudoroseomonas globiformis]|uniref:Thioredoxin domain-containing protein n=1 Tax=Teichococcus globiformis TaxID=2307229 RepID=A0ABV7FVM2_9PROT
MPLFRRELLLAAASLSTVSLAGAALSGAGAQAPEDAPGTLLLPERGMGDPAAPMQVIEYFSMTCSHCATFHRETWPRVREALVDTGRVRMIWRDFPLDGVALEVAQVARAAPANAYEPLMGALLASQERWAFTQDAEVYVTEIARVAALAGMPRWQVEAAMDNGDLRDAIMQDRLTADRAHHVTRTPFFVFNGRRVPGAISFARFVEMASG